MMHSRGSVTRAKMNAPVIILFCSLVGSIVCYNVQRELYYQTGPNDPYAVEVNPSFGLEPSQRIFWGSGSGSNQVGGGNSLWSKLTNKFPFLENMFGRMTLPTQYGVPNVQQQYGLPNVQQQYGFPNVQQQYGLPYYQQSVVPNNLQPQFYNGQYYNQRPLPSGRDVSFTDDAVIVTPPFVPIAPQPVAPVPDSPAGYNYNKPQYRLELPHK